MKPNNSVLAADFVYAEFSADIHCPFCNALLFRSDCDGDEIDASPDDLGTQTCEHVGFWSIGRIDDPNLNESWRNQMFLLAKVLKILTDEEREDGFHWQELLNFALDEDGNWGVAASVALSDFQVRVYKHFSYLADFGRGQRLVNYLAILLRKRKSALSAPSSILRVPTLAAE